MAVPVLSLGACSGLTSLNLSAPGVAALDLRGCGRLTDLHLDCPDLRALDATFCSELGDAAIAAAVSSQPPLEQLVLSVCGQVGLAMRHCVYQHVRPQCLRTRCVYKRITWLAQAQQSWQMPGCVGY